jgi:hypothetical protein
MAGLQTIIDYSNGLQIDRRKVVGIQYTRNEIPRVSQTPTKNPWKFTISMPSNFRYNEARALLEELDTLDRITPQVISFSNRPQFSWMFAYQGTMTNAMINTVTVQSFVGDQLTLTNLPVIPSSRVLFAKNDLIQIGAHTFPFTSTTQITRGSGSTVTVTTSRPNIITGSVVGDNITVGNACQFYMFCPNMPTYKLTVGGQKNSSNGTLINNALIEWSEAFEFYEFVGTA